MSLTTALTGAAFGLALEKSKVYLPDIIIKQMLLQEWTMATMFFTAAAGGTIIITGLEAVNLKKRSCKPPTSAGWASLGKYGANISGGSMLGVGMALSGACPGTVFVQLGAGLPSAWYVMTGAIASALSFGYLHRAIRNVLPTFGQKSPVTTLDTTFNTKPLTIARAIALSLTSAVYIISSLTSWRHDVLTAYNGLITLPSSTFAVNPLFASAWSPIAGGSLIALLQLPSVLLNGGPIGTSGSYMELASRIVPTFDSKWKSRAPILSEYSGSASLKFVAGVIAGAAISSILGGTFALNQSLPTASPVKAVVGGALLVLGARVAGGCTSGHGISGMAQLSVASFVTVAAMFAGGILSAFALY
ncbi:hypothetical protein HK097_010251 [Rhizophlyctis rosea]|uniref:Sulphur transport domain-containing protein n=1 Tax=Rhizophlyctis rosea TaxID=64517 RepID=A0AAD5SAN2_9FUNG|nr:hypothetical protein HK097_010251 [Rhizophlyctis rosea]